MFHRKQRRFRRRSNNRGHTSSHNGVIKTRIGSNSFSNGQSRNNFRPTLSPEKLLEKYNSLAREAMSSGDKILHENYLQHADHFFRVVEDKNKNRSQSKPESDNKSILSEKKISNVIDIEKDKNSELK